eukprot:s567_g12.t1
MVRAVSQHFADGETFGVYGEILPSQHARPAKQEEDKIPVTILTGFLGSGKTTMLNYILQEQKEKKIAIIENEFGEVPIDDALLNQEKLALAEKIIVMDNGCMCCTIRGDLLGGIWSSDWTYGLLCCTSEAHQSRKAPIGLPLSHSEPYWKCKEDQFFDCVETNEDLYRLRSDSSGASTPSTRLPDTEFAESEGGLSPSISSYSLASLDEEVKAMGLPEMAWANDDTARRMWAACEGNQRRADKAFLQAMEIRLRDRRLYTTLQFEKRCDMRIIGYDKENRPVLYFCALSQKDWLSSIKDQLESKMMGESAGCLRQTVKDLADSMGCVFAERMARIILVDFSTAAQTIWWMLKPFLSEVTQRKFSFISARKAKDLVLNELEEATAKKVLKSFEVNRSELSDLDRERHNELTTVPFLS